MAGDQDVWFCGWDGLGPWNSEIDMACPVCGRWRHQTVDSNTWWCGWDGTGPFDASSTTACSKCGKAKGSSPCA
ncbi:MAG: hypothetical protein M1826_003204 [Phylliscum demangeonii]|nr:MAG: hypothetical protein M1826_003204 [Phylliscum demangeonii]